MNDPGVDNAGHIHKPADYIYHYEWKETFPKFTSEEKNADKFRKPYIYNKTFMLK